MGVRRGRRSACSGGRRGLGLADLQQLDVEHQRRATAHLRRAAFITVGQVRRADQLRLATPVTYSRRSLVYRREVLA